MSLVHRKEVVILGLDLKNIFVRDDDKIFLGYWDLAKDINAATELVANCNLKSEYIADEVKKLGIYGVESDVFSLGRIFQAMIK